MEFHLDAASDESGEAGAGAGAEAEVEAKADAEAEAEADDASFDSDNSALLVGRRLNHGGRRGIAVDSYPGGLVVYVAKADDGKPRVFSAQEDEISFGKGASAEAFAKAMSYTTGYM